MKIDKKNFLHWIYLVRFGLNVALALVLRPMARKRQRVLLYGHKLSGNLLAIYRQLRHADSGFEVAFLTMDQGYHRALVRAGERTVLATSLEAIPWLCTTRAVISDHGLHALSPMLPLSGLKFFDVWHSIPFKGFDADDFRLQHRYDEVWVTSPVIARMYARRYGFDADKVKVTGYARTDRLVRRDEDILAIKRRFGLDGADVGKIVLFAPTWKQDAPQRSIFPFGLDEHTFFRHLSALAKRTGATFVMRAHLNSDNASSADFERIVQRPYAQYPDTEALLLASDILICDWSSIAFDYLLLDRPTIFLEVEPPFAKGLSLDASHRFGAITGNMDELLQLLERYLADANRYTQAFAENCARVKARVYADNADGHATERCIERLRHSLDSVSPA